MDPKTEFVWFMTQLKESDPEAYEELKAEGWRLVAENHAKKTPEQLAQWMRGAS